MPTTITGTLVDAATNLVTSGTFVRFLLKGTQGIQPVVTGVGALCVGSGTGPGYFVDFIPNASGVISGSVYSTRDSTGLLAGEIKINGNGTACWWEVSIWRGNKKVSSVHTHAKTGVTLDVGNLTALSTTPVATAPSGDSTYARLDGANQPFTGNVSMNGALAVTGTSTLANVNLGAANTLSLSSIKQVSATTSFGILDNAGLSHFFISGTSPFTNTFVNGNGAGVVFLGSAAKTSVADTTGNIVTAGSLILQTAAQTLSATIANDTAGGILFTNNAGKTAQFGNGGTLFLGSAGSRGQALGLFGATSGDATLLLAATGGSNVVTIPNATDTLVGKSTTDTLTNKTLTAPVINGTPTGTGIPTVTLKKGSGGGTYSSASTSYVQVDGTNLAYTVTIPTGWKLLINAAFRAGTNTAVVAAFIAIADGGTVIVETSQNQASAGNASSGSLAWIINGDGASHTVDLRFKTGNAADSVIMGNGSATDTPAMTFLLTPSN